MEVSPFGLKYTLRGLGSERLRPYVGAGLDFAVTITHQDPVADESLEFTGTAPFDAPLIGGPWPRRRSWPSAATPRDREHRFRIPRRRGARGPGRAARVVELRLSVHVDGVRPWLHTVTAALGMHW